VTGEKVPNDMDSDWKRVGDLFVICSVLALLPMPKWDTDSIDF
jgi:hypothetical protein